MSLVRTERAGEICEEKASITVRRVKRKATHEFPVRLRVLATAEVRKGPGSVAEHRHLVGLVEESEEGTERALLEDVVAALG